ncbi:hypothetical protein [Kitasatospora sp. NPDC057015]|uniref:hypothetical protein n=1 Tax=Kitasatospora sp. NPDC057015 TaxID=3346001 RepID=UPI00363E7A8C
MTFDPYRPVPTGGYPGAAPVRRSTGGGLVAIGILSTLLLLSELGVLAYDISREGVSYLPVALGFSYEHAVFDVPVGFYGYDTGLSVALLALAIGAFSGGRWVRSAAVVLFAVDAYTSGVFLISQLTDGSGRGHFAEPLTNLLLNLTRVLILVVAVVVAIVVAATRSTIPSGARSGGPVLFDAPAPPPANPYLSYQPQAPQQAAPQQAQPGAPVQPYGSAQPYGSPPSYGSTPSYGSEPYASAQPSTPPRPAAPPPVPPAASAPEDRHPG